LEIVQIKRLNFKHNTGHSGDDKTPGKSKNEFSENSLKSFDATATTLELNDRKGSHMGRCRECIGKELV
jgi:hypothetical protein